VVERLVLYANSSCSTLKFLISHILSWGVYLLLIPYTFVRVGTIVDNSLNLYLSHTLILNPIHMKILGTAITLLGLILIIYTAWCQHTRGKGTPFYLQPTKKLVVSGPYKYVRNPMSLGIILFYYGISITITSPTMFFILNPCYIILTVLYLKLVEEKELETRFKEEYVKYKSEVPMLVPKLPLSFNNRDNVP